MTAMLLVLVLVLVPGLLVLVPGAHQTHASSPRRACPVPCVSWRNEKISLSVQLKHHEGRAQMPAPPRRPRAKKGEKAVGGGDVEAGGGLMYESSDHGVVQALASGGMDGTGAPAGLQDSYSAATVEGSVPFGCAAQTAHSPALLLPAASGTGDAAGGS